MAFNFQVFLDAVKLSHLVILYTLAGYLLASPASLRLWLATRKAPSGPAVKDEPVTWKKNLLAASLVLSFLAAEYTLIVYASPQVLQIALMSGFGFLFSSGTILLFGNLSGAVQWSAHRNAEGVPVVRVVKQKRNKKQTAVNWSIILSGLAVTIGAFTTNHQALVAIVSTAVIYNMSRKTGFRSISMRGMILALLGLIAGSMLLGTAMVVFIVNKGSDSSAESTGWEGNYLPVVRAWIETRDWLFSALYAHIPGGLIALCLRFDYQRHLDSSAASSEFVLSTVPAPESKKGKQQRLGEGVVLPARAPTAFSKVYYTTALVAWGLAQFGLVCLEAFTSLSLDSGYEFTVLVLFLELPVICVAILAMAAIRGESKTLWTYREVWAIKPETKEVSASEAAVLIPEEEKKATSVEQPAQV